MSSPAYVDQHRSYRNDWSRLSYVGQSAALYAGGGLPIFPLDRRTKKPCLPRPADGSKGGFHQATVDLDLIWLWWREHPDAMIGLATGPASDRFVVDIDGLLGEACLAAFLAARGIVLPATSTVLTPSGGRHLHFRWDPGHPVACSASLVAPHVDTRGQGGYVVVPPSRRADGHAYRWQEPRIPLAPCPPALLHRLPLAALPRDLVEFEPEPPASPLEVSACFADHLAWRRQRYGEVALDRITSELARAREGRRNDLLFKSACQLARLANGGCVSLSDAHRQLVSAAHACGLPAREIEATIRSGFQAAGSERAGPRDEDPGLAAARAEVAAQRRAWFEQRRRGRK